MSFQIPKDLQEKLTKFEQIKSQLQIIMGQKAEMDARKREIEEAATALQKMKSGEVFKRVGDLLIKVEDTEALLLELKEEGETLGVRVSSMENQEKSIKEMYEKMGTEINEALKGYK